MRKGKKGGKRSREKVNRTEKEENVDQFRRKTACANIVVGKLFTSASHSLSFQHYSSECYLKPPPLPLQKLVDLNH